jgi:HopA1 effector protein family
MTYWALPENVRSPEGFVSDALCEVRIPKEMRYLVPGFYMAIGNYDLSDSLPSAETSTDSPQLVRLYWHLTAEISVEFINVITHSLNAREIPFRVKVVSNPALYLRADAGVLYLKDTSFRNVVDPLKELYREISSGLRASVPMFTKLLAPGLALAEDPGNGESFGQSRCKLIAGALWNAYVRGVKTRDERVAEILLEFRSQRIDPAFPFLRYGSVDKYPITLEEEMAAGA